MRIETRRYNRVDGTVMKADPTMTLEQFQQAYHWGVRGFPTVILQRAQDLGVLTRGDRPFEEWQPTLDAWLSSRDTQRG